MPNSVGRVAEFSNDYTDKYNKEALRIMKNSRRSNTVITGVLYIKESKYSYWIITMLLRNCTYSNRIGFKINDILLVYNRLKVSNCLLDFFNYHHKIIQYLIINIVNYFYKKNKKIIKIKRNSNIKSTVLSRHLLPKSTKQAICVGYSHIEVSIIDF